jgi:hypothetical protein
MCKMFQTESRMLFGEMKLKVGLKKETDSEIIRKYLVMDENIVPKEYCAIGVGYNACTDVNFRAMELIKLIEPQILKME